MRLMLFAALMLSAVSAAAGNVKVTWAHDQATCADGSPGANCPTSGFELYQGSSETATDFVRIANGISAPTRSHALANVLAGRKCYYVVAVSAGGNSLPSNIGCVTVPFSPPKAPSVTVTVEISVAVNEQGLPQIEVKTAQVP